MKPKESQQPSVQQAERLATADPTLMRVVTVDAGTVFMQPVHDQP
jgi:hypothetical protein